MNTRINLLPWREARRKESERQFMSIGIGAVVLTLVIIAYAHIHIGALISNQEGRNQILNQEIAQLDTKIKEIQSLDTQRSNLLARMNIIQQLQTSRPLTVHLMDELIKNLPEGVYYTSAKMQGNALTLEGIAQSNARVSALMKNLDDSPWLENPVLDVIETNEKDKIRTTSYKLRVTQTQPGQEHQSQQNPSEEPKADQAAKP
ncbi:MAG: PilN domain-containing protein [Gammaproteobacteria bacterium]|nr:PilN domain-containing protein [Gammaproteobacteria bacterium]